MATIREVSRLARVSPATVSRVLNGTTPVNSETRDRVLEAVATLGYKPNAFARGLATNRSGGIGITVNEVSSPYFGAFIAGVEQVAREAGIHLMVSSGFANAANEGASIEFLLERRCDGLVVQAEALADEVLVELVRNGSAPVVVFGRAVPGIEDSCVVMDNERGGALAVEYLLACGHRRIGHITGPMSYPDARDRLRGYRRALEWADVRYRDAYVVESTFQEEGGAQAAAVLMDRAPDLTAIFVANDQMAAGAMRTLRDRGRAIPGDVSIVGFDDVFLALYLTPTLTTVRQPLVAMGRAAANLLLARLGHEGEEVVLRFEPELVERQSVARIAP
jgi:LacI family transcriptional regulator